MFWYVRPLDRRWEAGSSWTVPRFSMATRIRTTCFSTRLAFERQFGILTTEPFLVAPTALRFPRTEPLLQANARPAQADSTLPPLRSRFRSWLGRGRECRTCDKIQPPRG